MNVRAEVSRKLNVNVKAVETAKVFSDFDWDKMVEENTLCSY